ncbi:hypothetical protein NSP_560 [Nodularia spumigena CCY9414]|nr:hypothetical protein NSP_560 [Nodularia spumigena CCY9414]
MGFAGKFLLKFSIFSVDNLDYIKFTITLFFIFALTPKSTIS